MPFAEDMLAKAEGASVATKEKPADQNAINSEGGAPPEDQTTGAAGGADVNGSEEKKTELDRSKDGTVTVTEIAKPAEDSSTQKTDGSSDSGSTASTAEKTESPSADGAGSDEAGEEARALAFLSKKAGKTITSLDEFLKPKQEDMSEEDQKKAREKFENDAIKYGLEKNLFSPKTLEAFNVDRAKDPREIALKVFAEEQLASDPELAEDYKNPEKKAKALDEINERFSEAFFEHDEEGDWRRVRGQALMKQIADGYIQHKYGSVLNATGAFEEELNTQQSAVAYKGNVEKVFAELPQHLKITIEGKEFSYQIPENSRKSLQDQFLKRETFERFDNGNIKEEALRTTVNAALFNMEQTKFITEVCKAYASSVVADIKMGRKSIPAVVESSGTNQNNGTTPSKAPNAERMLEKQMAERATAR